MPDTLFSYSLQDFIPFGAEIYTRLFERINEDLWPWQLISLVANILLFWCCWHQRIRTAFLILSASWIATGVIFHQQYFLELVWMADYFAYGFFAQAVLLIIAGFSNNTVASNGPVSERPVSTRTGLLLIAMSLLLFPLMGIIRSETLVQAELFGIMPDPTCLATIGVLFCARRFHIIWSFIPLLWSLVTAALCYVLGLYSGFLVLAAITALFIVGILHRFIPKDTPAD